jgi:cell division protein FtsL
MKIYWITFWGGALSKSGLLYYAKLALALKPSDTNDAISLRAHLAIGEALYLEQKIRQSLPYFIEAVDEATLLADSSRLISATRRAGDAYKYMFIGDSAVYWYKKAIDAAQGAPFRLEMALAVNDLGLYYQTVGEFRDAIHYFIKAYDIVSELDDSLRMGRITNNLGTVYLGLNDYENALNTFQKSYLINTGCANHHGASLALSNMGRVYSAWKQYDNAIEVHKKSWELASSIDFDLGKAWSALNLGRNYAVLQKKDSALVYLQLSGKFYSQIFQPAGTGLAAMETGILYLAENEPDSAEFWLRAALKNFFECGNLKHQSEVLYELSRLFLTAQQYDSSAFYLEKSFALSKKEGYSDQLVKNHELLSNLSASSGDYKAALENLKLARNYQDSVYNESIAKNLQMIQIRFETDLVRKENELLRKDAKISELQLNRLKDERILYTILLIAVVLIALMQLSRIRNERRYSQELKTQNDKITHMNNELIEAANSVKELKGLLPICANCKKIRNDSGYWSEVESYISEHTDASFTHGLCPICIEKLYPGIISDSSGENHDSDDDDAAKRGS